MQLLLFGRSARLLTLIWCFAQGQMIRVNDEMMLVKSSEVMRCRVLRVFRLRLGAGILLLI
jgi:hypothetical protein